MGSAASVAVTKLIGNDQYKHLRVTNNPRDGEVFSNTLFSKKEWATVKKICNENNIMQVDLNRLFKR